MQSLCRLPLWIHTWVNPVALEGRLVVLVSCIPPPHPWPHGSYIHSASSSPVFLENWRIFKRHPIEDWLSQSLSLCILSSCGSQNVFLSAAGISFSDDDWGRHWSTPCWSGGAFSPYLFLYWELPSPLSKLDHLLSWLCCWRSLHVLDRNPLADVLLTKTLSPTLWGSSPPEGLLLLNSDSFLFVVGLNSWTNRASFRNSFLSPVSYRILHTFPCSSFSKSVYKLRSFIQLDLILCVMIDVGPVLYLCMCPHSFCIIYWRYYQFLRRMLLASLSNIRRL